MKKSNEKLSFVLLILSIVALSIIMCFNIFVFLENAVWLNIVIYAVIAILMLCLIWAFFLRNEVVFKLGVVCNILFVFVYFLYFILRKYGIIDQINSFQDIKNLILSYRGWGLFTYTIINFLQVVLIPIPSTLTILAGTAIFGPVLAFIFASIGILVGSVLAFIIGRYCSKPVLYWIFSKEKVDKYEKILSKRTKLILFLTLFLPFFPDDMICMLAGVTSIKIRDFLWISLLARSMGIATISFFGSGTIIPFNTGWGITLWCIIIITAVLLGIFAFKKRKKIVSLFVKNKNSR
ncbi:MAG: TVP38/TMEM64 family protein [Clostridia bacterium]|nr:TVP38/TMEM64 family protein [Clostridia bacterium]